MEPYRGQSPTSSPGPCPRCAESRLEEKHAGDVRIGDCGSCGGVWLDGKGMIDLLMASPRTLGRLASSATDVRDRHEPAACPQCRAVMRVEAGKSGVRYDVCDAHGIWFDAGELAAVLRFAGANGAEEAPARSEPFAQLLARLGRLWPFGG